MLVTTPVKATFFSVTLLSFTLVGLSDSFPCPAVCVQLDIRCECGAFTFSNIDGQELVVKRRDPFSSLLQLRNLNINLGSSFTTVLVKCNYDGSIAGILDALHISNLTMLTVDSYLGEASLQNFSTLPYDVQELQLQNQIQNLPSSNLPLHGLEKLRRLSISNTRIKSVPPLFLRHFQKLTFLQINQNSELLLLDGQVFDHLSSLSQLSIAGNRLKIVARNIFHPLKSLRVLNFEEGSIEPLSPDLFSMNSELESLSISTNSCEGICERQFNSSFFSNLPNLQRFSYTAGPHVLANFSQNSFQPTSNLKSLMISNARLLPHNDLSLIQPLKQLQILSLESTRLRNIRASDISPSLTEIRITGKNHFDCDRCETISLLWSFFTSGRLVNNVTMSCKRIEYSIIEVHDKFCAKLSSFWIALAIVLPIVFLLCGIGLILLARIRHEEASLALDDGDFECDAFISYETSDEDLLQIMQVELEENNDFRCLIHTRDFEPGEFIVENIVKAVQKSRTVIIVLSRKFLASEFCHHELVETQRQGRRSLVVMRGGDRRPSPEEIKANAIFQSHIKAFTYLEESDEAFQRKLVQFLEGRQSRPWVRRLLFSFPRRRRKPDHIELQQTDS